jgi:hypothetical protein
MALVHTTLYGIEELKQIVQSGVIGRDSRPLGYQPPAFEDKPLIFCSFIGGNYTETYGERPGIIFETDSPPAYACPADTAHLMRGGIYLPGHEQFLFSSIEEMLQRYPHPEAFKKDFQDYFRKLNPEEVYPHLSPKDALRHLRFDYCFDDLCPWNPGCTEVTFPKPLKIKNHKIFLSRAELESLLGRQ